jgi:Spy/CpxP family protein refolding chaperone
MNDPAGLSERTWRIGPRMTAALVIALAFIVGGLAGASLLRGFGHRGHDGGPRFVPGMKLTPAPVEEAEEGHEPGHASERARARFAKALDLTPAQAAAVDTISLREFEAVSAVRTETWPRMQAVLDDTRRRIDSILTPDQRTRYHEMLARQEEEWQREQSKHDSGSKAAREP